MTRIELKNLGVTDMGDLVAVHNCLAGIEVSQSIVHLNLQHCILDYPGTSFIVDCVLKQLSKLEPKRELKIQTDYYLPEATLLNYVFLGSEFFDLDGVNVKAMDLASIKAILIKRLVYYEISLSIEQLRRNGEQIAILTYG